VKGWPQSRQVIVRSLTETLPLATHVAHDAAETVDKRHRTDGNTDPRGQHPVHARIGGV
jgi:hypothetical protein